MTVFVEQPLALFWSADKLSKLLGGERSAPC